MKPAWPAARRITKKLMMMLLGGMALKMGRPNGARHPRGRPLPGLLNGGALLGWTDRQSQIVRGLLLPIGVGLTVFANERGRKARRV